MKNCTTNNTYRTNTGGVVYTGRRELQGEFSKTSPLGCAFTLGLLAVAGIVVHWVMTLL